jgi:glycosyltransferase involved in cell wall biosynthesis
MWLFVGPTPLAGIGQVVIKYADMTRGDWIQFGNTTTNRYDDIFVFLLPIETNIKLVKNYYEGLGKNLYIMTICETKPVHPDYSKIFSTFPNATHLTPSKFCADIFEEQFGIRLKVVPLWSPEKEWAPVPESEPYTFYTIGNILDPRKNIKELVQAFKQCDFPKGTARLLLKATCHSDVHLDEEGIEIINGLLSVGELETQIHSRAHCYINFSHSEGVGMGAVEAALRKKPVVITDFGGLKEYISTPFLINCTESNVGIQDFLFNPDMTWGEPDASQLITFMKECYEKRLGHQEHPETVKLMEQPLNFFRDECRNTCIADSL